MFFCSSSSTDRKILYRPVHVYQSVTFFLGTRQHAWLPHGAKQTQGNATPTNRGIHARFSPAGLYPHRPLTPSACLTWDFAHRPSTTSSQITQASGKLGLLRSLAIHTPSPLLQTMLCRDTPSLCANTCSQSGFYCLGLQHPGPSRAYLLSEAWLPALAGKEAVPPTLPL